MSIGCNLIIILQMYFYLGNTHGFLYFYMYLF